MDLQDLNRFERCVLGLPRPLRRFVMALMLVLAVALLTLPIWRRLV